jgi:hypothetical protein
MSIQPEGKPCSDIGRVLVLTDPAAGGAYKALVNSQRLSFTDA